jgi:tetratricopeptide (TPR) repeat protein
MSDRLATCTDSTAALMGEIVDEFLDRLRQGESPDVEAYARQYPQLATIVRELLCSLQVLQLPISALPEAAVEPAVGTALAGPLGDFQVVREIGRGGMGLVYEAVQLSLGRRVALKLLPFAAALDGKRLQRFKNEAHAAAHLHHQNIVPVYTVGCERGVHFYAMQFIDGQTVAAMIAELQTASGAQRDKAGNGDEPNTEVTIRTVTHLAMQAAEALEHAHKRGVVHRDVKPANLLVDGQGRLWVTDFGLAQVVGDTRLTLTGDLVGTLRYMSPEQALAYPGEVDHRADIYSLGATLYELLTLRPAFAGRDRRELLRQIAFDDPTPPRRLNKAIPAELETIVLKAIAKQPAERFATARDLADDLRRFLDGKPIRARRPSWPERAHEWARRHQPAVRSAAAALLVIVMTLSGGAGWLLHAQAVRQARLRSDLETALAEGTIAHSNGEWPRAYAAARRAETLLRDGTPPPGIAARVRGLLGELSREEADRRLVARLQEIRLLQSGLARRENRFALERARPAYQDAFENSGLAADSVTPAEAAAIIRQRPLAVRSAIVAALDHWLVLARSARASETDWLERVLSQADTDPWRQRLRAAQRTLDRHALEGLARDVASAAQPPEALFLLDRALHRAGARDGAVAILRRAQESYPGDFWINHNLGVALLDCASPEVDDAVRFLTAAAALRPESPGVQLNLGLAFWRARRNKDSLAAFRRAIARQADYVDAHVAAGVILLEEGRLEESLAAFRRAAELSPDDAIVLYNLGNALFRSGDVERAIVSFRRAFQLTPDDGEARANLSHALCHLGVARDRQGRHYEAIDTFREAVRVSPDFAVAHFNLGITLQRQSRYQEALAALRTNADLRPNDAPAHYNLGNAYRSLGRVDDAAASFRRALEIMPDHAEALCNLGGVLRQQADYVGSLAALKRGHELGSLRSDWTYPSAQWVLEGEQLLHPDPQRNHP